MTLYTSGPHGHSEALLHLQCGINLSGPPRHITATTIQCNQRMARVGVEVAARRHHTATTIQFNQMNGLEVAARSMPRLRLAIWSQSMVGDNSKIADRKIKIAEL